MKPKEYIKKYGLDNQKAQFNHKEFVADLTIDFMSMIEFHQQSNWNFSKFQNCIKDIRKKYDSISIKTAHPHINEKLWKYFYATVVGPVKDKMFGEYLRKERERHQHEKEERDQWRKFNDGTNFFDDFLDDMFSRFLIVLGGYNTVPHTDFVVLGITTNSTVEQIKKRYKELAFQHHPDKGGSINAFRKITESKNRCLAYASQHQEEQGVQL